MSNDFIGFIGGGNMTRAIAAGLIEGKYPAEDLLISEPAIEQRAALARDLPGVIIEESNDDVARRAGTLVLAVKPQVMHRACEDLQQFFVDCHCVGPFRQGRMPRTVPVRPPRPRLPPALLPLRLPRRHPVLRLPRCRLPS